MSKEELEVLAEKYKAKQNILILLTFVVTSFLVPVFTYFLPLILNKFDKMMGQSCESAQIIIKQM
jgi:flagellar basal body-associated protein FliL